MGLVLRTSPWVLRILLGWWTDGFPELGYDGDIHPHAALGDRHASLATAVSKMF